MKLLNRIPHSAIVALSGGVDSVTVLDFLRRNRQREVSAAFFNHGTQTSMKAERFVTDLCAELGVQLSIGRMDGSKPKDESWEEHWRNQRYEFLHCFDYPVITAHNLDDCVETWLFSAMHGTPKVINYSYGNVIRPFLLFKKSELKDMAERRGLRWIEDETNLDISYMRNYIRHEIVPRVLVVNPGIYKVVARKVRERNEDKRAFSAIG